MSEMKRLLDAVGNDVAHEAREDIVEAGNDKRNDCGNNHDCNNIHDRLARRWPNDMRHFAANILEIGGECVHMSSN